MLDVLERGTVVGVEVGVVEDPGVDGGDGIVGVLDLEGRRYQKSEVGCKRPAKGNEKNKAGSDKSCGDRICSTAVRSWQTFSF